MEFEEVVKKSHSTKEFNENVRKYLALRNIEDAKERRKHYWALFYKWKEKISESEEKV